MCRQEIDSEFVRIYGNLTLPVLKKCCRAWNIGVRKLLHLPLHTQTRIHSTLSGQNHPRVQVQFRLFCFMLDPFHLRNHNCEILHASSFVEFEYMYWI